MTSALSLPQRIVGLAAIPAGVVTTAIALTGSAAAAAPVHGGDAVAPARGTSAAAPARVAGVIRQGVAGHLAAHGRLTRHLGDLARASGSGGRRDRGLQTLFGNVRVFSSASTEAAASGQLGRSGTGVSVTCWTTGLDYNGNPIWYRISAPISGYVAAFNLSAHFAPAAHVAHCASPAFAVVYNSLESNLRIRSAPSTTAAIAGYLAHIGSKVTLDCYVTGSAILGDPVWYHAKSPASGYVTGRFLNTGGDPALGVPRC
jgi:hypothetical protein